MSAPQQGPDDGRGLSLNGVPVDGTGARTVAPMARTLLLTGSTLLAVPVVLGVVVVVIGGGASQFAVLPFVAGLVVGIAAAAVVPLVGYRVEPLAPGDPAPGRTALQRFQSTMLLRMAVSEVPALVALALTVTQPPASWVNYLPGGLVALALLAVHVRPTRAAVGRIEQGLDANGVRSGLSGAFGY